MQEFTFGNHRLIFKEKYFISLEGRVFNKNKNKVIIRYDKIDSIEVKISYFISLLVISILFLLVGLYYFQTYLELSENLEFAIIFFVAYLFFLWLFFNYRREIIIISSVKQNVNFIYDRDLEKELKSRINN